MVDQEIHGVAFLQQALESSAGVFCIPRRSGIVSALAGGLSVA
jgi:hypothetical protein